MMEDLPFTVEEWSGDGETRLEVLARATNLVIARAALIAAIAMRPHAHLLLRHGIRLVAKHRPQNRRPNERQGS